MSRPQRRRLSRGLACGLLLATGFILAGCPSPTWSSASEDAAARLSEAPSDVAAQVHAGELAFLVDQDPARALSLLEPVAEGAPAGSHDAQRAALAVGYITEVVGRAEAAETVIARALVASSDPVVAEALARSAGAVWGNSAGAHHDGAPLVTALEGVARRPGAAWQPARAEALRQLVSAARLRGTEAGLRATAEAGYLLDWRMSGPWGDVPELDIDRSLGPETRALAEREDTGHGFDEPLPTWDGRFSDGEATFFDLQSAPGIGFAQVTLPAGAGVRRAVLHVETNRSVRVFANGAQVLAIDGLHREPWEARVGLELPATAVRLTVKLATSDGRGLFRARLLPLDGPAEPIVADVGATAEATAPVKTFAAPPGLVEAPVRLSPGDGAAFFRALGVLDARIERPYHDPIGARALLERLRAARPDHPALALEAARIALSDGELPDSEQRRATRAAWETVIAAWPHNLVALHGLAGIEAAEDRPDAAYAYLKRAWEAHPDAPSAALALARHERSRGREAEALELGSALERVADRGPLVGQEIVDLYTAYGYIERARAAAARLDETFPGAALTRVAELDIASGAPKQAGERLLAAFAVQPEHQEYLRAGVKALRAAGEVDAAREAIERFLETRPQDAWALSERVRIALQAGDDAAAQRAIDAALEMHPGFTPMELLGDWLAGRPEVPTGPVASGAERLDDIADGRAIVARYLEAQGKEGTPDLSGYPVVTLYERRAIDVRSDGSTVELTHRVHLVQTKSGADSLGDFRPPRGTTLLAARTLKADGRVLWPERTRGKADLSFPELEPGDAIETAWIERDQVSKVGGGYLSAFIFGSWDVPALEVRDEVRVARPLVLNWRSFGDAPAPTRVTRDDRRQVVAWELNGLAAVPREPLSIGARSFFPFVDLNVYEADRAPVPGPDAELDAAAWRRVAEGYAGRIKGLTTPGPQVLATAQLVARRAGDEAARGRAAFAWVKDEIDDSERLNGFRTPVEAVISQRKGSRTLVMVALARALGVEIELLVCAPERDGAPEDVATPTPNGDRFFYPIVRVGQGDGAALLDFSRPFAPYDSLPLELYGARCLAPERVRETSKPEALFVTLPDAPAEVLDRLTWRFDVDLSIGPDGAARGTIAGAAYGPATSGLRRAWENSDEARRRLLWQQWAASLIPGVGVQGDQTASADAADSPMRWKLDVSADGFAVPDGDDRVVQHLLKPLLGSDLQSVPELAQLVTVPARRTPLRVLPLMERTRIRLEAPPGFAWDAVPPEITLSRGPHHFAQRVRVDGAHLEVTRHIDLRPDRVEPSDYPAFRALIQQVVQAFEARARLVPR